MSVVYDSPGISLRFSRRSILRTGGRLIDQRDVAAIGVSVASRGRRDEIVCSSNRTLTVTVCRTIRPQRFGFVAATA